MDINEIKMMKHAGMTIDDISYAMEVSTKTVERALRGEIGGKQREIADRVEYFFPDRGTGCYSNGAEIVEDVDSTFEEVAFFQELELFLEKIEKNSK